MLQIVHYPHPALRWKSQPIRRIDRDVRRCAAEMLELMYEANGVGLAANQVALPWRLFVMNPAGDPEVSDLEFVVINPEIHSRRGSEVQEEGCLSLPKVYGDVQRAQTVVLEGFDVQGQPFEVELADLAARVAQHELDHLDGVMFFDRMAESARRELDGVLSDFETVFRRRQAAGDIDSDERLKEQLRRLEQ